MGQKDKAIAYLGRRVGKLTERCEGLASMCNDLATQASKAQQQMHLHDDERLRLERLNGTLKAALGASEEGRRELQTENEAIRTEAQGYRARVLECDADIERLDSAVTELNANIANLAGEKVDLIASLESAERTTSALRAEIADLKREEDNLRGVNGDLEAEVARLLAFVAKPKAATEADGEITGGIV